MYYNLFYKRNLKLLWYWHKWYTLTISIILLYKLILSNKICSISEKMKSLGCTISQIITLETFLLNLNRDLFIFSTSLEHGSYHCLKTGPHVSDS